MWETIEHDASTGKELNPDFVRMTKDEELQYIDGLPVYDVVDETECWDKTRDAPVSTRWTILNKGDDVNPYLRARWVARDFKIYQSDEFFASTPPGSTSCFSYPWSRATGCQNTRASQRQGDGTISG